LPADNDALTDLLKPYRADTSDTVSERILASFTVHPRTGLRYFSPQLKALERLVEGENIYSLLWDDNQP
jgi:hypothetical protein